MGIRERITSHAHEYADAAIKASDVFNQGLANEAQAGYPNFATNVARGGILRMRELIALRIEELVTPEAELPRLYANRDQGSAERTAR